MTPEDPGTSARLFGKNKKCRFPEIGNSSGTQSLQIRLNNFKKTCAFVTIV